MALQVLPTAPQATMEYRPKPISHKICFPLKHYHYGNIRRRDPRAVPAIPHQRRITAGHCGNYGLIGLWDLRKPGHRRLHNCSLP